MKKTSLIIINWHQYEYTIKCVDSCLLLDYADFDLWVLDNQAQDQGWQKLEEKYKEQKKVKLFKQGENLGFAEGNNFLIRKILSQSDSQYLVCLNNDTTVEKDFLLKLTEKAEQGYEMVNAEIRQMKNPEKIDTLGQELTGSMLSFSRKNEQAKLFCPSACACLYTRKLLETIAMNRPDGQKDYFDADYFLYAEDLDLGWRALLDGFKPAYALGALVYHFGSGSTSLMSDFAIYQTYRNLVWTIIKNLPCALWWRFSLKMKIGHWAIIFLNIRRGKGKIIFKSYFDAFKQIPKFLQKRKIIQKNKKISNQELLKYINKNIFPSFFLRHSRPLRHSASEASTGGNPEIKR